MRIAWRTKPVINIILNTAGIAQQLYHNSTLQSLAKHTTTANRHYDSTPKSNKKSLLNKIVNEAGLPTEAGKWHKLAVQQDLVLVCYGSVQHLDNRMSCFVSRNDASTGIWPVWRMNFNNSTVWEALLSWVIERFYCDISVTQAWFIIPLGALRDYVGTFISKMFTLYLHSSASHQSISLCLCSSHGINTNSPLSSRLTEWKRQEARQRRDEEEEGRVLGRTNITRKHTDQNKDQQVARSQKINRGTLTNQQRHLLFQTKHGHKLWWWEVATYGKWKKLSILREEWSGGKKQKRNNKQVKELSKRLWVVLRL